jgi:hypothetical protein
VKQSGQRSTAPRAPAPAGGRTARYRANRGSGRAVDIPPNRANSGATPLATDGASSATRAASGRLPSA